jgi:hypothetical protein
LTNHGRNWRRLGWARHRGGRGRKFARVEFALEAVDPDGEITNQVSKYLQIVLRAVH